MIFPTEEAGTIKSFLLASPKGRFPSFPCGVHSMETICFAKSTVFRVPRYVKMRGFPCGTFWSTSKRQPARACKSRSISPPLPMTFPTYCADTSPRSSTMELGFVMVAATVGSTGDAAGGSPDGGAVTLASGVGASFDGSVDVSGSFFGSTSVSTSGFPEAEAAASSSGAVTAWVGSSGATASSAAAGAPPLLMGATASVGSSFCSVLSGLMLSGAALTGASGTGGTTVCSCCSASVLTFLAGGSSTASGDEGSFSARSRLIAGATSSDIVRVV
mmetsp:Transcript_28604/g.47341  ORF Transcript_28604/g.47341 Transcript_28604/m.47341 type:complete len:274 (+) Transcript_28604:1453-2274(+)